MDTNCAAGPPRAVCGWPLRSGGVLHGLLLVALDHGPDAGRSAIVPGVVRIWLTRTHFPSGDGSDLGVGLLLTPFRGVRYDLSRVGGLANVTSPPYDVIGPGTLERLLAASPYNVVRLILPADILGGTAARSVAAPTADPRAGDEDAAARLRDWLAEGALTADGAPAFYVYEQRGADWVQRGLIGLVGVGTGAVLPHEGVMAGPVAGRRELMKATRSNLEPILLVYNGGAGAGGHGGPAGPGDASRLTDRTADGEPPLACAVTAHATSCFR